ncbi:protein of unknown function [Taphrina deformans PYCC 5710]|uniref:C2H2-type domain-containing protein n=1 Tax=Taphrina deformans (strain PYCC 5710 / ATCC 11124 / CBS 356.35 / IMI 108563 / JCM 9778 / NBRC 8474) TaxID=1097556 RepID=R4XIL5_TAPDE|nr:protein of unknown function [Taphrina deformans PYCC 5710]|eukprot:CCG84344.1 protein of unknown function [Taphrina deformans PYCC 5710]
MMSPSKTRITNGHTRAQPAEILHHSIVNAMHHTLGGSVMVAKSCLTCQAVDMISSEDYIEHEVDECLPRLEANFCKDFSCCGLVLDDLHDLLQHYEDHHVKIEDEHTVMPPTTPQGRQQTQSGRQKPDLEALKRRAMLDMQYHLGQNDLHASSIVEDDDIAFDNYSQHSEAFQSRKRTWRPSVSSPSVATRDFFTPTQSPQSTPASSMPSTPTLTIIHDFNGELDNPLLFGPPASSDDWLFSDGRPQIPQIKKVRQTQNHQGYTNPEMMSPPQVIEHPGSNLVVVEKPYKCPVPGCDKAYKNQNGLKYHKMHGNCAANPIAFAAAQASGQPVSYMVQENKPYSCNLCAKRYKNLNGLKYHTAHSHQHVTTDSVLKAIQESGSNQAASIW